VQKVIGSLVACMPFLVGACLSPNTTGSRSAACLALGDATAPVAPWPGTVFTIVMENRSRSEIFGNRKAPFINSLAAKFAVADGYHDAFVHPSEANYLWMSAGQNFGVLDDSDPRHHHLTSTSHIADQIERAGLTWKAYQEGMGAPCGLKSHGRYAAKHDPFVYYDDVNGWDGTSYHPEKRCNAHVVDYSVLDQDLASHAVPRYAFITPDLDNDMHDGSIAEGDAWLSKEIPKIMASDAYQHGGVIFLLWDEGGGLPASDDPPFIAIAPNAKPGYRSNAVYDTSSYVKTVQTILGLEHLPCGVETRAQVPMMADLFTTPIPTVASI
jgi:acid phosphatase